MITKKTKFLSNLGQITQAHCEKIKVIAALLLVLGSFFVVLLGFGIKYEVNDDAIISSIASGALGGSTERLIYINILIGYFLQFFYSLVPGINWYVWLQLASVVCCFVFLCYLALDKLSLFYGCILSGIFMILIGFDILMWFQYSKNAAVLCVTGIVCIRLAIEEANKKKVIFFYLFGGLMMLLGSMIRFESFAAAGALSLPFLCLGLKKKMFVRLGAVMGSLLLCAVALEAVHISSYQNNDEWVDYFHYNEIRTEISDYRMTFANEADAAQYGLSPNEFSLIQSWNFYDSEVFTTERLTELAQQMPSQGGSHVVREFVYKFSHYFYEYLPFLLLGFMMLAFLFFGEYKKGLHFLLTFFMLSVLLAYLLYVSRLPHRVEIVLLFSTSIYAALCFPAKKEWRPQKALCGFALCATILISGSYLEAQQLMLDDRDGRELNRPYFDTLSADKDNLYIVDVNVMDMMMGYDVFEIRPKGYFSNIVFLGGWQSNSPIENQKLQNYGYTNPYRAMLGENTYYVTNNYLAQQAHLQQYYNESAHTIEVAELAGPNFGVFRMETE